MLERIRIRRMLIIMAAFILIVPIGTLTHELGHFFAAKYYGYNASLSHGYTLYGTGPTRMELQKLYPIKEAYSDETKKKITKLENKLDHERIVMTLSGPFVNMFIGSVGFVLLAFGRKKNEITLSFSILVLMALFWSREVLVLLQSLTGYQNRRFNDEITLAYYMDIPTFFFAVTFGLIGIVVCFLVVFKFCPPAFRTELFVGGIIGSGIGFVVWMSLVSPLVLP